MERRSLLLLSATLLITLIIPLSAAAVDPISAEITDELEAAALLASTYGDFTYTVSSSSVSITGYSGSAAEVVIPDTIEGYPVTKIGSQALRNNTTLTKVTIPASVTAIDSSTFCYSGLTSIAAARMWWEHSRR